MVTIKNKSGILRSEKWIAFMNLIIREKAIQFPYLLTKIKVTKQVMADITPSQQIYGWVVVFL
jgi:hypothetical protein